MVDFIFPATDEFYCVSDNGILESYFTSNNGTQSHFLISNINVYNFSDKFFDQSASVITVQFNDNNDLWFISDENVSQVSFDFITEKSQELARYGFNSVKYFHNIVETIDFMDSNKDLIINLVHYHDGVSDIIQTLSIDYKDKDDNYNIIHDEKGDFSIVKK